MKQRVITGIFIGIGFVLLYFVLPLWCAVAAFGIFSAVGVWELLHQTGATGKHPFLYISMAAAFLLSPVSVYGQPWHLFALVFVYMVLALACGVLDHTRISFATMAKGFLAAVILPLMLTSVVRILQQEGDNPVAAMLPWLVVWVCDSAALFVGRAFGKRKLAPYVSPKKTVAGFVGGLAGGVAVMAAWAAYVFISAQYFSMAQALGMLLFGLLGAGLGQLGDLSLSVIKRECGIKDYGRLFPGHGGVWDRFDSIIFVAPVFEILFIHILTLSGI